MLTVSPGPVLPIMLERAHEGFRPGIDDDGRTIVEAYNGGGMKGSVELGIAWELAEMGLKPDKFAGISIGSFLAAARITGQLTETLDTLTNVLPDGGLVDKKRLRKFKPLVDLSILENAVTEIYPLDVEALAAGPELGFAVTKLNTFEPVLVSTKDIMPEEAVSWLMRGVHLPRVAGKPPEDESGTRWADGGLSCQTTTDVADELGATHTLLIANEPPKIWEVHREFTTYVGKWIRKHGPENGLELFRRFSAIQADRMNTPPHTNLQTIHPFRSSELPGVLCMDKAAINNGFEAGRAAARAALGFEVKGHETHPEATKNLKALLGDKALRKYFALTPCVGSIL